MKPFPQVPAGLITKLQTMYPDKCPRENLSAFDLGVLAGQQIVIDLLTFNDNKQQESVHVHAQGPKAHSP